MKQALQQLLRLWRELGINQRITLGASAIAVLGGMVAVLLWAQRPQMKLLYGGLGEKEAAEIVATLEEQKVPFEIRSGGSAIYVRSDLVYKMRMDLAAKGLPAGDGVGFEIFDRNNFGISDFVQRTNYSRALQGELSRTIAQLKGVHSARVMVALPENRLLLKTAEARPTASVFVDTGGSSLDMGAVNSIRSLVANSVEGLRLDDVAVVDSRGNVLSDDLKNDPQLGSASSQIKFRRQMEDYLSGKVETMLAKVLGPGNAVVRVSAEINTDSATLTEEKYDPEGQVARSETTTEDKSLTSEKNGSGAAGVTSNLPDNEETIASNSPTRNTEEARKSKTQTYEINRSTRNIVQNPGAIKRLTAAVFVASKPAAKPGEAAPPRTPQELSELRLMVVNALGIQSARPEDLASIVSLQEVPFPTEPAVSAITPQKLTDYAEIIRPIGALVMAGMLFFIFFRLLKRTKPEEITFELIEETAPAGAVAGAAAQSLPAAKNHKVSPELLNDLIRQKPDNVGATLRDWLANKEGN